MAEGKKLTVQGLRGLARKHLGTAAGKLKTRDELLKAVSKWLPKSVKEGVEKVSAKGKTTAKKVAAGAKAAVKGKAAAKKAPASPPAPPAGGRGKRAAPAAPKAGPRAPRAAAAETGAPPPTAKAEETHAAEPLVEGFFVARVLGEGEARRHHLTESQAPTPVEAKNAPVYDEHLGELPDRYADDSAIALPRDPHTLFVYWDFRPETHRMAAEGLVAPRTVLRIFDGDQVVREIDFALESRSFYIHDLPPGRHYRVEAFFVGRDGQARRIGQSTPAVQLPRLGPSSDTSVRFLRIPWGLRLSKLQEWIRAGLARYVTRPVERRIETWRRVALPGSRFRDISELTEEELISHRTFGASERLVPRR